MMKKVVFSVFIVILFISLALGQTITPIAEIQDTTGTGSDESKKLGETVTISGTISAESWAFDGYYFVQDAEAKWSGIMVYDSDHNNAYGDSVQLTGTVEEYYGMTQISDVTNYTKLDTNKTVEPVAVTTGEVGTGGTNAEAYEAVLVKVESASISNPDKGNGEWAIDDGSGECMVDDEGEAKYYFDPSNYDNVKSITGVMNYSWDDHKILPRLAYDIISGGEYTRIQRIQQVRYSDLLKTPKDYKSDMSYYVEDTIDGTPVSLDTIKIKGVVTMPTAVAQSKGGVRFIIQEENGGPWSSILSYNESADLPNLKEGYEVELIGYVGEFTTNNSNMTEFWTTSSVELLSPNAKVPAPDTINTGDLRHPTTAEQWGNVFVTVKNVEVTEVDRPYDELFLVDDGTGEIIIDSNTDSLDKDTYSIPPVGTSYESITGWVYHHYGSYDDSSTYVMEPLYEEDLVRGSGPPNLKESTRDPSIPNPNEDVNISVNVTSNSEIENVKAHIEIYDISDWQGESDPILLERDSISLTNSGGNNYTGTISAKQKDRAILYHIEATNNEGTATLPMDTSKNKLGYYLLEQGLSIKYLQLTPYNNSLYDGYNVEVAGVVTADTSFNNNFGAFVIQDGAGPWNGIFVRGLDTLLKRGDEIRVYGEVSEQYSNTKIFADSIDVLSSDNIIPEPNQVQTIDLSNDTEDTEQYEGTLVEVTDVEVSSINDYDWSIDDGSGSCLLDEDAAGNLLYNWLDSLEVGQTIDKVTGVYVYSFDTYKITPRDLADVGEEVAIEDDKLFAKSYKLQQNYPNPFNPTTHIAFQLPTAQKVKLSVYNILGQKVRTLATRNFTAGSHVLIWNGTNNNGATLPSGAYFLRMEAGNFTKVRKMLFLK
ncbi:MAG: T9SS type A sorting domain-containing protein [Candidatus Marinimicrobia bacterium]|nr:T9SS type A sorting domain-containing protein [Candidatus Neomarinimicrobiota bacterium]